MPDKSVLVAYTTNSGSTEEVAKALADEMRKAGLEVDLRRLEEVENVESYAGVLVGAPMILGWHRAARRFIQRHQLALSRIPVAYFMTAMSLTEPSESIVDGVPILVDPKLAKPPKKAGRLSLRERYATAVNYVRPALKAAPAVRPVSIALLGGKLELFRLKPHQMLFVMAVIRAEPGDRRNWPLIREWGADFGARLSSSGEC